MLHLGPSPWVYRIPAALGIPHWRAGVPCVFCLLAPRWWVHPGFDIGLVWYGFTRFSPKAIHKICIVHPLLGVYDLLHIAPCSVRISHYHLQVFEDSWIGALQDYCNWLVEFFFIAFWDSCHDERCYHGGASVLVLQNCMLWEVEAVALTVGVDKFEDNTANFLSRRLWERSSF